MENRSLREGTGEALRSRFAARIRPSPVVGAVRLVPRKDEAGTVFIAATLL
jgi:hypothetical protein